MKAEQINEILRLHGMWLRGEDGGTRAYLSNADLRNAYLSGADLSGAYLSNAYLHGVDLSGARLSNANLRNADLHGANLRNADLHGANLRNADLSNADLRYAYLSNANLRNADLHGVDLSGARLSGADLSECRGVRYASVSWHGHGECGRQLLAVDHGDEGIIYHCGCFRGSRDELERYIADGDESMRASRTRAMEIVTELIEWGAE